MICLDTNSLQAELFSSIKCSEVQSDSNLESEISESETDLTSAMGSSAYRKAARTFRAIARTSHRGSRRVSSSGDTSNVSGVGESVFQSYTISRENSFSPDDMEYFIREEKLKDDPDVSDDSGTGRSTGLGSLSSSAPREEVARELLRQATRNSFKSSQQCLASSSLSVSSGVVTTVSQSQVSTPTKTSNTSDSVEVVEVQTVGQLRAPAFQLSSSLLQSTPLGSVPGHRSGSLSSLSAGHGQETPVSGLGGHPGLGLIPGKSISALKLPELFHRESSDFDETEPLEPLTTTRKQESSSSYLGATDDSFRDYDETEPIGSMTFTTSTRPSLGNQPGSGSLGGGHPGLGSLGGGHPGPGSLVGGHPGLRDVPGMSTTSDITSWPSQDDFSFDEDFTMPITYHSVTNTGDHRGEKSKHWDSGVISGDYSEDLRRSDNIDIDALSDGGYADVSVHPGLRLGSDRLSSDPLSVELESTLKHLNPAEVERRRRMMGQNYR